MSLPEDSDESKTAAGVTHSPDVAMECETDRTDQEAEETDVTATGQESMYNCSCGIVCVHV